MVRVKICGITNLKDALDAARLGCDGLGFVFYKKSPRYIAPEKAKIIVSKLAPQLIKIGVFANAREKTVKRIAGLCNLNILQFHGQESPAFCERFAGYKVIKAFRIKNKIDLKRVLKYKTFAYLFDTFVKSKIGGTGKEFNWNLLTREFGGINKPVFLSGGLNDKNVKQAIRAVRPAWVDASSSLEIIPGSKDTGKIKKFIRAAKSGGK
jgi:phosphoribosylanthranilate isomerase